MSLIAHYRLEGNAEDSIGQADGIATNVTWVNGKIGQAGSFSGNGNIDFNDLGNIRTGSLSFWYKKRGTAVEYLLEGRTTGGWWLLTHYQGWDITFLNKVVYNGIPDDVWTHVIITASPTETQMFINGSLVDTGGTVELDLRSLRMGVRYSNSGYLNGEVDDFRIYDHVLSEREIRDLSLGLILHLKGDSEQPLDSSGQGNTFTNGGTVFVESSPIGKGSYQFDNKSDRIVMDSHVDNSVISVSMWYEYQGNSDGVDSTWNTVLCRDGGGSHHLLINATSQQIGFYNSEFYSSGYALTVGNWYHLVMVKNGSNQKLYIDGMLVQDSNSSFNNATYPLKIIGNYGSFTQGSIGKITDVRVFTTELPIAEIKELYQQRGSIDSIGNFHSTFLTQNPRARYIRDWLSGSTSNSGKHWLEIRAMFDGQNISLNKPVTSNGSGTRLTKVTDGSTSNSGYAYVTGVTPAWVQVDLEEVRNIDEVKVWHYNADGRTYYDTKTEISEDGINWTTIFDSQESDIYQETSAGITHEALALGPPGVTSNGFRAPDISEAGITRGLVAWYPLEKDTKDYADINDAVNNGATLTADGYEFIRAENDYMQTPNLSVGDNVTMSCVVTPQSIDNGATLGLTLYNGSNSGWRIYLASTGAVGGWVQNSAGATTDIGTTTQILNIGQTYTVVFISTPTEQSVYVNGELGLTSSHAVNPFNGSTRLFGYTGGGYTFNGIGSNVKIHNVALTPEEIAMEHKLLMNPDSKVSMTADKVYITGQFKEV